MAIKDISFILSPYKDFFTLKISNALHTEEIYLLCAFI